eukprot:scaffold14638_cov87-Cyclotella_meneghiniana.AAC.4
MDLRRSRLDASDTVSLDAEAKAMSDTTTAVTLIVMELEVGQEEAGGCDCAIVDCGFSFRGCDGAGGLGDMVGWVEVGWRVACGVGACRVSCEFVNFTSHQLWPPQNTFSQYPWYYSTGPT